MTIKEIISGFNLLEKDKRPPASFRWSTRLLLMHGEDVRSALLEIKYKVENKPADHADMHILPCLKLEKDSGIDCKKLEQLGCKSILKTESLLPDMISLNHLVVRSVDGSYTYDYIRWEDYTDVLNSKYKEERDKPFFSLKVESEGIRIFILNDPSIETISIEGIFHSIIKPYLVKTCESVNFDSIDYTSFRFPISPALKNDLYLKTFEKLMMVDQRADPDIKGNDASDATNPTL